ncbi:MAG: hypothetical protein ABJD07_14095 [Gemmatimonadaceae bacterium]
MPRRARIFILSPATAHGKKGRVLLEHPPRTPVAKELREHGMPIGSVFRYLSGLYFNGKLAYARAFAQPPASMREGVYILTTTDGLVPAETRISTADLERFAGAELGNPAGRAALDASARELARAMGNACDIVFLGSVAGDKYTGLLEPVFRDRLIFPRELLNRGQLARGALLLTCVIEERELDYAPVLTLRAEPKPVKVRRSRKAIGCRASAVSVCAAADSLPRETR